MDTCFDANTKMSNCNMLRTGELEGAKLSEQKRFEKRRHFKIIREGYLSTGQLVWSVSWYLESSRPLVVITACALAKVVALATRSRVSTQDVSAKHAND